MSNTPLLDAAPKVFTAVAMAQDALAKWIVPDSGISDKEVLNQLLEILDNKELVAVMRKAKG